MSNNDLQMLMGGGGNLLLRRRMMMQSKGEPMPPSNQIWYDAESQVTLYNTTWVTEHTFSNGRGVVKFDRNLNSVQYQWFRDTPITNFYLPKSIKTIGNNAFRGCHILGENLTLNGITSIEMSGFAAATLPATVNLPDISTISMYAFDGAMGFSHLIIGEHLTSIAAAVFRNKNAIYDVVCKTIVPASLSTNQNFGTFVTAFYVPAEAVDAYKNADG